MSEATTKVVTTSAPAFSTGGLLGVVFVTLKLCHVISWSWLWVLAPFWMPIALALGILALVLFFLLLIAGIAAIARR